MYTDFYTRLGAAGGTDALLQTPQDLTGVTTAGVLSTNYVDLETQRRSLGEGEPVFLALNVNTSLASATANVLVDVELLGMPYPLAGAILTFADTAINTGTDVFTVPGHGLRAGMVGQFTTATTLPTGISASTNYYVVNPTTDTFQVSATPGGSAVNITAAGTGPHTYTLTPSLAFVDANVTTGTDQIAITDHQFAPGTLCTVANVGGALPTGLAASTHYYVHVVNANAIKLSTTPAGTPVDITAAAGGGAHILTWVPQILARTTVPLGRLAAGHAVAMRVQPLPDSPHSPRHRYWRARITPSATLTAGKVFVDLVLNAPSPRLFYPSGFSVLR